MDKKIKVVVLGIVRDNEGKILITQRFDPKIKDAHLKWDVPGGTNEFGESLKETIQREILEETGLNVEVVSFIPETLSKTWEHEEYLQHTLLFGYKCKLIDGELNLNDPKISNIKWVDKNEIENYDFLPTSKFFINLA